MIIYIRTILQPLEMNPKRMFLWWCAQLVQVKITLDDKTLKQEVQDLKRLRDAIQKTEHHEDHEFCHYSNLSSAFRSYDWIARCFHAPRVG